MWPDAVLDRFVEECPAAVMVRATLENLVSSDRLDEIFADASQRQYEKELLFSQLVALMMGVATRTHTSVHAGYLAAKDRLAVSPAALYGKLNRLEPGLSATMIRETSQDAAQVIDAMPGACRELLPGYHVQYLDGNHLAATEHRLAELRVTREGPLPGQTLALLDAQWDLISELLPCEDGACSGTFASAGASGMDPGRDGDNRRPELLHDQVSVWNCQAVGLLCHSPTRFDTHLETRRSPETHRTHRNGSCFRAVGRAVPG